MELATMTMDRDEARARYVEYRDHVRKTGDTICAEIMRGYRAMSKGLQVIDLAQAMQLGGVKIAQDRRGNEIALPALAVMRADAFECHLTIDRWTNNNTCIYTPRAQWHSGRYAKGTRFEFTIEGAHVHHGSAFKSVVPHIPPRLLPKYSISNYHVLWEADWHEYPADPALLQYLGGDLYVVLGVWDLTPLERTVLRRARA